MLRTLPLPWFIPCLREQPSLAALRLLVPCLLHDVDGVAERGEEATDTKNDVQNENEEEDAEDVEKIREEILHDMPSSASSTTSG